MQLPLSLLDATVAEEVPVELWRQLFEAVGWPPSLDGRRRELTHAEVLEALERDSLTDELLLALEALVVLGSESGGDAILGALQDQRLSPDALARDASPRELALRLFLAQREDAAMADVFVRAQSAAQHRGDARPYHEFLGREARRVRSLKDRCAALEAAIRAYAEEHDLGDHVQVRAFEDDGTFTFHVIRSHRTQKPLAVLPGQSARAMIRYRPVHSDLLRYDATTGRLRIAARAATVVPFLRRALGEVLFEDPGFFAGDAACSLKVLQEGGQRALDTHDSAEIGRVWMTECLWERGDRSVLQIRSSDCFRDVEELGLPLREGELLQAKLKVQVIGPSTRPVTVSIRAPSRITVSDTRHEALVDRYLSQIGIRQRRRPAAPADLWSLYPWRHPISVWQAVFGRDVDSLIERGALTPVRLEAVEHPGERGAGRVLRAVGLDDGVAYGVGELPEISSRSLTATDLDGFALQPERFREALRSRLGIPGPARQWSDQDSLLDLGAIAIDGVKLHLAYALRRPAAGIGEKMRAWASGAPHALLVSVTAFDAPDLPIVLLDNALPARSETVRAAISAAGLADQVSAHFVARDGARLVVDTGRQMVWVDGVAITGLTPDSHPYRFVLEMARSTGPVTQEALTQALSGARRDGTTAARQAKKAAKDAICDALIRAGRDPIEDPFPSCGTGAYRSILPSDVR